MLAWSMHIQRCKIFFYAAPGRGIPSARSSAAYSLIREFAIFCLFSPEAFRYDRVHGNEVTLTQQLL